MIQRFALWLLRFKWPQWVQKYLFELVIGKTTLKMVSFSYGNVVEYCAIYGHDWRKYVPGYEGWVCVRCGSTDKP